MVGCREIAIKGAPRKQKHLARSLAWSVDVLSAGEVGEYLDLTSILPGVIRIVLIPKFKSFHFLYEPIVYHGTTTL